MNKRTFMIIGVISILLGIAGCNIVIFSFLIRIKNGIVKFKER